MQKDIGLAAARVGAPWGHADRITDSSSPQFEFAEPFGEGLACPAVEKEKERP